MNNQSIIPTALTHSTAVGGHALVQAGFIVEDLDAAVKQWVALGVGPFFMLPHLDIARVTYRGAVIKPDVSIALAHAGGIQLELMVEHSGVPSVWHDEEFPMRGVHHLAIMVSDYDAAMKELADQGIHAVTEIQSRDVHTAYLDGMDAFGFLVEVQEERPSLTALNDAVAEASRDWDGSDPIRTFDW